MANLRRHFNFSTKLSVNQDREIPFPASSTGKPTYRPFDKNNFMNDICNCLDLCCAYIQALNSVCDAGSSLARNLFNAVKEVHPFQNVSLQFLSIWEEVSKATAGASAAVKTETLMMLQEILNSLEMGKSDTDTEEKIAESFQVIGTCLCSFIELQAQFSLSTWKSFSKLTKYFTSDSVRHSLQWKSLERNPSKITVNTALNTTIKKYFSQLFSKVGMSKLNETTENNLSHFLSTPHQSATNISTYSPFHSQHVSDNVENSAWPSPSAVWSSYNSANLSFSDETPHHEKASPNLSGISDLDEVINLLSCVPVHQPNPKQNDENQNYFQHPLKNEQMYHLLRKSSIPISRGFSNHQSWSEESKNMAFGYDSWLWRVDNINCSGLSSNTDSLKLSSQRNNDIHFQWDNLELQKWNTSVCETGSSSDDGSSIHGPDYEFYPSGSFGKHIVNNFVNRKHCNGESMPGGLENISESKEECLWGVQSKISTWPLKQSTYRNSDGECPVKPDYIEYGSHFIS